MNCVIDGTYDEKYLSLGIWGKPTIVYPIESALTSNVFESVIVVTKSEYIKYLVEEFFADSVSIHTEFPEKGIIIDGRAANITAPSIEKISDLICPETLVDIFDYFVDSEESIIVDSSNNFELTLVLCRKRQKNVWLKKMIRDRINEKERILKAKGIESDICLVGHSQFDQWDISELNGYKIRNCGISGITAKEYSTLILDSNRICLKKDSKIFILIGVNDVALPRSIKEIAGDILELIQKVRNLSNGKIYYLEMLPINGRLDRDNNKINEVNQIIRENLDSDVSIIKTDALHDRFGNLNYKYTTDGLHLNVEGYNVLEKIMKQEVIV